MIAKLLREKKPELVAFCLDSKEPSFRKEIDPEYKAHRTEMPEDLQMQVPYILKIAEALGIVAVGFPGYEADDIIGTFAYEARAQKLDVVIVSGDKDFAQIISPHIKMYDSMKEILFGPSEVEEKWGVPPHQFRDFLAITGDSSDNIPGVAGIGPKGAVKLLKEFGSLKNVYDHLPEISSKSIREKLEASEKAAFRSQQLVTIVTDMKLPVTVDELHLKPQNPTALKSLLHELEFKSFERLLSGLPNAVANPEELAPGPGLGRQVEREKREETETSQRKNLKEIEDITVIESTLEQVTKAIPNKSEVWLIPSGGSFALGHENKIYLVSDDVENSPKMLSPKNFLWCGFDLKQSWRSIHLIDPHAEFDAQLAIYVLRPQEVGDFFTEYSHFFNETLSPMTSVSEVYQGLLRISGDLLEKLPQIQAEKILNEIELPIASVLYEMEERGVLIDKQILADQSQDLKSQIATLETEIYEHAGEVFNIGSPKQLSRILFEKLKLPVQKKTKTGFSTDNEVLEALAQQNPICENLIEYRELTKLKSTYVDALPALINPQTGRIHTTFNQALTSTGRLSSSQPNLQNIPIRTERGQRIRQAFVAEKGEMLLSADYSQIELRILAHITSDSGLINAFQQDLDIHQATAAEIFGLQLEEVTPDLRRKAKAVNFGIAYGQGAFGLSQTLGISRGEAQGIIDTYFKKFRGVAEYMKDTIEQAKFRGYVESLFGRRRYLPELRSENQGMRKFGERAAINAPIQGTASDLVKMAMIRVYQSQNLRDLGAKMILQVHDELVFEVPEKNVTKIEPLVRECMSDVFAMKVPLKVNIGVGINWEQAH